MMEAFGWVAVVNGQIDLRTLYDSRVGAIVNWAIVHRDLKMTDQWTNEQVEAYWRDNRSEDDDLMEVRVEPRWLTT